MKLIYTMSKKAFLLPFFLSLIFLSFFLLRGDAFAQNERFPYFSDVERNDKNFFAITSLMQSGVINGYKDGTFKPHKSVSRAETLKILLLGSKIGVPNLNTSSFSDVPVTEWFAPYVLKAKNLGVVKGRGNSGKFFPADTINTAEALKMLLLVNSTPTPLPKHAPYADVSLDSWFAAYFAEAQRRNLFDVKTTENINPSSLLTRGDLAEMMYRYKQYQENVNFAEMRLPDEEKNTAPAERGVFEKNLWSGLELDSSILPVFRKNESFIFSGKVTSGKPNLVSVLVTFPSGKISKFSGKVEDGKFSIPVFFDEAGEVKIGLLQGRSGEYISYLGTVFSGLQNKATSASSYPAPTSFSAHHQMGKILLSWKDTKNTLFHIQLRQKKEIVDVYVNRANKILLPVSVLNNFHTGDLQIFIRGAQTENLSSLDLKTKFSRSVSVKIPVFERFTETEGTDDVFLSSSPFEYDRKISLSGGLTKSAINQGVKIGKCYVLTTDEKLVSRECAGASDTFSFSFFPNKKDFYVVEVSDQGGRALTVVPIVPDGYFPVIPNDFDRKEKTRTKVSSQDVFRRINTFRKNHERSILTLDPIFSELAQLRADDMNKRGYFGHVTPGGKSVNDFRSDFGIQVSLFENIAVHSFSGLDAEFSLEYSPTHRENLLEKGVTRVGVGIVEKKDGSIILVELFGEDKISDTLLEEVKNETIASIELDNIHLSRNGALEKMTQQWANTMAEKKDAQFEFDSGESWDDLLDRYRIQRTTQAFVGSFPSRKSLADFIENKKDAFAGVTSDKKKTFGLSLAISDEGVIFLSMVGEE